MFDGMMKALFKEEGASLRVEILEDPSVQSFIDTHAGILDSAFKETQMSDVMRRHFQASDRVFSGFKTFHELNESFPQLLDENGNRKPFERFLNDVRQIDDTYNRRYLNAEYNFAQTSAEMAGRWEEFDDDDRYYLQYRTQQDDKVRPEHAELEGITLPKSDSFWDEYYPPNGWNCRCTVVEVRKDKYRKSNHEDAMARGARTLQNDKKGMFKFNPGKEQKTFPDYNPYTISKCKGCDVHKLSLANKISNSMLCKACRFLDKCNLIDDEIEVGRGKIIISRAVNRNDSDYSKLYQIAECFADKGSIVELTPKLTRPGTFQYDCVYSSLRGTKYEWKCPDLRIDGNWYEHEGFISNNAENAFKNMLNHGLKQSSRIVIDNPGLSDSYMRKKIRKRLYTTNQVIDEIWIREDTEVRLLMKIGGTQ